MNYQMWDCGFKPTSTDKCMSFKSSQRGCAQPLCDFISMRLALLVIGIFEEEIIQRQLSWLVFLKVMLHTVHSASRESNSRNSGSLGKQQKGWCAEPEVQCIQWFTYCPDGLTKEIPSIGSPNEGKFTDVDLTDLSSCRRILWLQCLCDLKLVRRS